MQQEATSSQHEPPLEPGAPYPADTPAELPKRAWLEIAKDVKAEAKGDNVTLMSAGVALWSASSGVGNLISALNVAYDEEESRGWVKRKLLALGFTLGAILFFVVAFGALTVLPKLLSNTGLGTAGRWAASCARGEDADRHVVRERRDLSAHAGVHEAPPRRSADRGPGTPLVWPAILATLVRVDAVMFGTSDERAPRSA